MTLPAHVQDVSGNVLWGSLPWGSFPWPGIGVLGVLIAVYDPDAS